MMASVPEVMNSNVFKPIFKETEEWLRSPKVIADMRFVLCFCKAFWIEEMDFAQSYAAWMVKDLSPAECLGGYRCEDYPIRIVLMFWKLEKLDVQKDKKFKDFRDRLEALQSQELADQSMQQASVFLAAARLIAEKHFHRFLTQLVDCTLMHSEQPIIAFYAAQFLLAIYDDRELPSIAEEHQVVSLWDQELNLLDLLTDMTQFVTADQLRETSVLFMYPEHVSQIRIVVENGWNFNEAGDAGRALMRKMKSDIRDRPMQNQTSGRRVGRIQQFLGRYMTRLDEEVVSIKHQRKGEPLMSNLHVADAYI